jgi:nucleotide-binding universal stress UspA family protein
LARRFQSRLTALHVTFSVPPPTRLAAFARRQDGKAVEEARGQVAAFVREQLSEAPELETEIVSGLPQDEITRAATRLKSDLIVIATHGRTGLKRWLMGSTAEQVIRHAPCPVLVVRERQTRPGANRPGARPQGQARPRKLAAGPPSSRPAKASRSALPRRNPLGWPRLKEGKFV